jgi:hypothetical protein
VVWAPGGRIFALPTPASSWGIARSVDDTGNIVGDVAPTGKDTETVTWTAGRGQKQHGNGGGRNSQGKGLVNGRAVGQIEVRGADNVDRPRAVIWDAATGTETLPPLGGDPAAGVSAASDSGVVAGFSANQRDERRPLTWTCVP